MRALLLPFLLLCAIGTAPAYAEISVSSTSSMQFGSVVMDTGSGDTLTLDASTGTLTKAGSSVLSGFTSAGAISITGTADAAVSITLPSDATIGYTGGDVTLTNFSVTGGTSQSLDGSGALSVGVGCDLQYDANISNGGALSTSTSFLFEYN